MSKELNFAKAKKTFLTVTMPDDKKILVRNPTKRIMRSLGELGEDFKELENQTEEEIENTEAVDRIYETCALILSNNIARETITVDYLEDLLDVEDLIILFESYTTFISDLQASVKN